MPRSAASDRRAYKPFREVVATESVPAPEDNWLVGYARERGHEPPNVSTLLDVLSCGHRTGMVVLPPANRDPYYRTEEKRYRRCSECPRVTKEEAGP